MKALVISRHGEPSDAVHVAAVPEPDAPASGEVTVQVLFSPVNHADRLRILGHLGAVELPAVAGNEGVGQVVDVGNDVTGVQRGDIVPVPLLVGAWRERLNVHASSLIALPDANLQQLSMVGSNSATAALALSEYASLNRGDWVIQSGANGGFGRNVIALARSRGLRTLNVVRRQQAADELRQAGADAVIVESPHLAQQARDIMGDAPIRLAVDGVGGTVAQQFAAVLEPGGTLVRYADASGDGVDESTPAFTDKHLTVSFIFTPQFDFAHKIAPAIVESAKLIETGQLNIPIDGVYPLDDFERAFAQLARGRKVLFEVGARR
jgi:NADPH:quinone reductase-like Zn-dependent oxidoreductase